MTDRFEILVHRVLHRCVPGGLALEDDAAGVFTLSQNADEGVFGHHHDGSNVMLGHHLERFVGGFVRRNGVELGAVFSVEDMGNNRHGKSCGV